jgi:hypothetical protein
MDRWMGGWISGEMSGWVMNVWMDK